MQVGCKHPRYLHYAIDTMTFEPLLIDEDKTKEIYASPDCQEIFKSPFQSKWHFCSGESKQVCDVEIKGNNVVISYEKIKIKGVFKNGLLFTNDPEEIEYRHNAGKYNYGKYYIIGTDYFSILNSENGEFFYYQLCKK